MLDKSGKNVKMKTLVILTLMVFAFTTFICGTAGAQDMKYSTGYMPFEPPTIQAYHTLDAIEKKSGGKIKFKRFAGGALGGVPEQLELVSSGAVDVISCHVDQYAQNFPLLSMLGSEWLVDGEKKLAGYKKLRFEIPETKAILAKEEKNNNIKMLMAYIQGTTGLTARFDAKSLSDLKGKKVNVIAPFQRKIFDELGWIPVNVQIPELYEALSRGVIDSIFMATAAVLPLKWYEVGKVHLAYWEHQVINQPLAINIGVWNKLPPDIQKIIEECANETAIWSIEADKHHLEESYAAFKKNNVPIIKLSDEDNMMFWDVYFKHSKKENISTAERVGVKDEALVIQKYLDDMKWGKYKK